MPSERERRAERKEGERKSKLMTALIGLVSCGLIGYGMMFFAKNNLGLISLAHPTPDGNLSYSDPTDCKIIGDDNRDIAFANGRVYWGTGRFPAQICFSEINFNDDRQKLIDAGLDPNQQLFINFLGYDACSGFTENDFQGEMRPSRVSPHALAAQWVYAPYYQHKDLNDPFVRSEFNRALTDQFQQWVLHEWQHTIHAQNHQEPGPSLEATAISAEYSDDTTPVFIFEDPTTDQVQDSYPDAIVNGVIDYNLMWDSILKRINQTCTPPNQ